MRALFVEMGSDLGQHDALGLHDTQLVFDGGQATLIQLALQLQEAVLLFHFRQTGAAIHETIHRLHQVMAGGCAIQKLDGRRRR